MERQLQNPLKHLKPGIKEVLDILKTMNNRYALGLLTGNIEHGARMKLEPFDLNHYFAFGAFGSDMVFETLVDTESFLQELDRI